MRVLLNMGEMGKFNPSQRDIYSLRKGEGRKKGSVRHVATGVGSGIFPRAPHGAKKEGMWQSKYGPLHHWGGQLERMGPGEMGPSSITHDGQSGGASNRTWAENHVGDKKKIVAAKNPSWVTGWGQGGSEGFGNAIDMKRAKVDTREMGAIEMPRWLQEAPNPVIEVEIPKESTPCSPMKTCAERTENTTFTNFSGNT